MLPLQVPGTSPPLTPLASLTSVAVAALAIAFAALAWRASRRKGNPALRLVAAAFGVFAVKNAFSAVTVLTHRVPHDAIELVISLFDLVTMLLLVAPFLARRR